MTNLILILIGRFQYHRVNDMFGKYDFKILIPLIDLRPDVFVNGSSYANHVMEGLQVSLIP